MICNMSTGLKKEKNYTQRHILIKFGEEMFMNLVYEVGNPLFYTFYIVVL